MAPKKTKLWTYGNKIHQLNYDRSWNSNANKYIHKLNFLLK